MRNVTIRILPILFAVGILITGCLERQIAEADEVLEPDTENISVPSDCTEGRNLLSDTVVVSFNRTWSAVLSPEVDWVSISSEGQTDYSGLSRKDTLFITFLDNETESLRETDIRLVSKNKERRIHLSQAAIKYRAVIESDLSELIDVEYQQTERTVYVNSNTEWTVSTKEGSEIALSYSRTSGKYSGSFDVFFPENEDALVKKATIILSAKGCSPVEIPVSQMKGVPYFNLLQESSIEKEEGLPDCSFKFKTNAVWEASLETIEGYKSEDVTLSISSGSKVAEGEITVKFPYCFAFGSRGKIVVKFNVEGMSEPVRQTITQMPVIRMRFYDAVKDAQLSADNWPTASPTYNELPTKDASAIHQGELFDITLLNGVKLKMYSTMGVVRYSKGGIVYGKGIGDYIAFPAFPGVKLVKMTFIYGNAKKFTADVRSPQDTAIPDSEFTVNALGDKVTLNLSGTENNTSYKLVSKTKDKSGIRDLILYYE